MKKKIRALSRFPVLGRFITWGRLLKIWLLRASVLAFVSCAMAADYSSLYQDAAAGNAAMIMVVTGERCAACEQQKKLLDEARVTYFAVDVADPRAQASKTGNTVPQIAVWRRVGDRWTAKKLGPGVHTAEAVRTAVAYVESLSDGLPPPPRPEPAKDDTRAPLAPAPPPRASPAKGGEPTTIVVAGETWLYLGNDTWVVTRPVNLWYNPQTKQIFIGGKWIAKE